MAKTLQDYLLEVEKEYEYIVKFACEIDENHMNKLENVLKKYDVIDIQGPNKSIIQKQPLDFPNISNVEVYTLNIKTRYPMALHEAIQEIRHYLGIEEKFIVVRPAKNEDHKEDSPLERYNDEITEREDEDYNSKLEDPYHEKDGTKHKSEEYYGDEYNKEMKNVINKETGRKPTDNEKKSEFKDTDEYKKSSDGNSPFGNYEFKKTKIKTGDS